MKRILSLLLLLLPGIANAADVALKAPRLLAPQPASSGCTTVACVGFFIGGSIANSGGTLDVIGTGLTGLASNELSFGGQAGYEIFRSNLYAALFIHGDIDSSLNTPPGTSFSNRSTYGACARLGYSLAGVFGTSATTGATPTLPQALLSSLMTPYVNICEDKRHNQPALATGAGIEALIAANSAGQSAWTLNLDYLHYTYGQGGSAGSMGALPVAQTSDDLVKLGLNYHFGF